MKSIFFKSNIIKGFTGSGKLALLAMFVMLLGGCTKDFEKMNTNPVGITDEQLLPDFNNIGLYYPGIQQSIFGGIGEYQVTDDLLAANYCGYSQCPNPFSGNINNATYALIDGDNAAVFDLAYGGVMGPVNTIAKKGTRTENPDFWAIALIVQVQAMSRVTDYYGPIPYSKVGQGSTTPYDSQKDVYDLFFLQLDTAVANLQAYVAANPGIKPFQKFDMVYKGDYTQWIKYANSLRLRLAMHIVNIDPVTAEAQALKAINNPGGLITINADNASVSGYGYVNAVWWIGTSWTDLNAGAAYTSYLDGYNDPRLPILVSPATSPASIAGKYVGIRAGTPVGGKPMYTGYAMPNFTTIQQFTPMILMTAAEVWFLKAEAALRGWIAESPKTDYETGILTSMEQWGANPGNYINDNTSVPADFVDPLTPTVGVPNASINAMTTIKIAWNGAATNEENLERIITQKWIAMFPYGGVEAWATYRRTGYPRLFPVVVNYSGGTIDTDKQIRRIQYPSYEYTSNADAVNAAVSSLGGPDLGSTSVWWDTNKGNPNPVNF